MPFKVSALRSVELGIPDVRADRKFYTDTWGLAEVAEHHGGAYLRGSGTHPYILALIPRPEPELLSVTFAVRSHEDLAALFSAVKAAGAGSVTEPARIAAPGGGYGFAFKDGDGRVFRLVVDDAPAAVDRNAADRPERLTHVVLNAAHVPRATRFFLDVLGFRLSDQTAQMDFLRCNSDHHSIAFARETANTLHHVAFLLRDLDAVMRGAGRMKDRGWPIEWGVGRHGPGNNVFAYFVGPDDVPIEYTAEVQQVDDSYPVRGASDWRWPPGRSDQWGVTAPPSARLLEAQRRIRFAAQIATL
jgi:catechol 2,3-dioxygenase